MATQDEDAGERFLQLVGRGALEDVRSLLDAAPALIDVAGPHPFWGGRPQPLHVAIETGRQAMFELLLERGADVDGLNDEYDHWSPLMLATRRPAMRDELIRRGARVGLAEALLLEDDALVAELLRLKGVPDTVPNGGSLLAFARTVPAIDLLLDAGAAIDATDRWGSSPIASLSRLGTAGAPLVRHMIRRGAVATPAEFARIGDLASLQQLADVEPAAVTADAVVIAAVDARQPDVVAWLLRRGGSPNARTDVRSRHTALHSAAWNGDLPIVRLLLEAGADPAACDEEYDATPLGWAETAIEVTNNPACAEVAAFLGSPGAEGEAAAP
jgi:ankyrin repeat protein